MWFHLHDRKRWKAETTVHTRNRVLTNAHLKPSRLNGLNGSTQECAVEE